MPAPDPTNIAGRYAVERKLGAGAFGTVYLAKDDVLGRQLAIKTVRLDALAATGAPLEELMQRFQREARVSAQLKHPNIVTIYDVGESEGLSYLAMEYIEGVGLESLIASEGRLSPQRTAAIGAQVAEALAYAHSQGVVHRDVKPANIMIEADDRVKVTDFGIAKAQTAENLTATGSLVGTPAYMSPEQARGGDLDGRSDLFSLGCVLYEMLSGARAFAADSITGLIFKVITEPPRPLLELAPDVPAELLAIVQRSLSKAPETRFPDGTAMAAALRQAGTAAPRRPPRPIGDEDPTLVNRSPRSRAGTRPPRGVSTSSPTVAQHTRARRAASASPRPGPEERSGSGMAWLFLVAALAVIGYAATRGGDDPEASAPGGPGAATAAGGGSSPTPTPQQALRGTIPAAPPPRIGTTPVPAAPVPSATGPSAGPPGPGEGPGPGGSATPPPAPATGSGSASGWPPPGGQPPPPGHGGPGGRGGPPGAGQSPEASHAEQPVMNALSRLAQAQAQYFQQNSRYGSLVQLQRAGLMPGSSEAGMRRLQESYSLEVVAGRSTWRAVARPRSDLKLRTFEVDQTGSVRSR